MISVGGQSNPQNRQRIVVVEDDDAVRLLLRNVFESEGFAVNEARNGSELQAYLKAHEVSLVTLDLTLRHEDGFAIARAVRGQSSVPIIMITAKGSEIDKVVGLELGADDYISKPFNIREVCARVRAVLRRGRTATDQASNENNHLVFSFDGWRLDSTARQLFAPSGSVVDLTAAEFSLLEVFASRPSRVLTREALLELVGGSETDVLHRAIDTLVGRLRKKIETSTAEPKLIKTVRGAGYIFAAKVSRF